MPKMARLVVPGVAHHVTQRGNRRQDVFFSDADRQIFLQLIFQYLAQFGLQILSYCLMKNHTHFICIPSRKNTLALVFKPVHTRYAQYQNHLQATSGHLWQGRFRSCPMDDSHLWAAIRYVERNPVRAGIVSRAEDFPWSSAAAHCGLKTDPLLSPLPETHLPAISNWSEWLIHTEEEAMVALLRKHTRTGRPVGSDAFIDDLELRLGRRVRALKVGRPRK